MEKHTEHTAAHSDQRSELQICISNSVALRTTSSCLLLPDQYLNDTNKDWKPGYLCMSKVLWKTSTFPLSRNHKFRFTTMEFLPILFEKYLTTFETLIDCFQWDSNKGKNLDFCPVSHNDTDMLRFHFIACINTYTKNCDYLVYWNAICLPPFS